MLRLTTIILERNGKFHAVLDRCSTEDAERWIEHGYLVFRIAVDGKRWGVNFVNEGRLMEWDGKAPTSFSSLLLPERIVK